MNTLDRQLYEVWERLAFRYGGFAEGPISHEEWVARIKNDAKEWADLLARAHNGHTWLAGPGSAVAISQSLWYQAMVLGQPLKAVAIMERCLAHPGPFDRTDRADLPARLWISHFMAERSPQACDALRLHLQDGPYRPGTMARHIVLDLSCWLDQYRAPVGPVSGEAASLLNALGVALRAPKRMVSEPANWGEFDEAIGTLAQRLHR